MLCNVASMVTPTVTTIPTLNISQPFTIETIENLILNRTTNNIQSVIIQTDAPKSMQDNRARSPLQHIN